MKKALHFTTVFLAIATLFIGCSRQPSSSVALLGQNKVDALGELGTPTLVQGPTNGYQTYHYEDRGLDMVFHDSKVVQYVIRTNSTLKTEAGVGIGADISDVARIYGKYNRTEEVTKWFGGNVSHVLYHHKEFDKYKINYPDNDTIFMFDENKKVDNIVVGYIFPVENDSP